MEDRAPELVPEIVPRDPALPKRAYATPRLTRWGTIPRVTQIVVFDFSGLPPS